MTKEELLERYESLGNEEDFLAARPLYEQALAERADARVLRDYGYLLQCHGSRELRRAVDQYERAIALDPDDDTTNYQLIFARAALGGPELAVDLYEQRLSASPGDVREHRFLARAYLAARAYDDAGRIVDAGLALAPDDAALVEARGEVRAASGDPEGALADWRRALELDDRSISGLYSTAFLLEREGRRAEAASTWEAIIAWNEARGYDLQIVWPREMLERLRS
ncbi:MAG TPA: tetratricopeptide repeat protein [Gaiellaceae bacterium]